MNLQQRLELLKVLDERGTVHRKEDYVDNKWQDTYVLQHQNKDYVQFCEHTGMIVGYGDNYDDFTFADTQDDRDDTQWALDILESINDRR